MKTLILVSLCALSTAQAQFSSAIKELRERKAREAEFRERYVPQPPPQPAEPRHYRHDQQHDWQDQHQQTQPRGTYPSWPQDPHTQPPPVRRGGTIANDDLFFSGRHMPQQEPPPQTYQQRIKELQRQTHVERELEQHYGIEPGINFAAPRLPIRRPQRQDEPEPEWQSHTRDWQRWTVERNAELNRFARTRAHSWQQLDAFRSSGQCWQHYGRDDWRQWRRDYDEFRVQRCQEQWNASYWIAGQLFDTHWWQHCPWAGRAVPGDTPGWWAFQPASWDMVARHIRLSDPRMKPRDPGTDMVVFRDHLYIEGHESGSAEDQRQQARALAANEWRWEPPFPGGRYHWLPLGVWALSPQEYGGASMFFQLALAREGIISGAFTNISTGEEFPVSGLINWRQQRCAWRIGTHTETVFETGLGSLTWDAAGVFLHFPHGGTQTWLLTRLPMPGSRPGAVVIPFGR